MSLYYYVLIVANFVKMEIRPDSCYVLEVCQCGKMEVMVIYYYVITVIIVYD
jgi:hypothetical protein